MSGSKPAFVNLLQQYSIPLIAGVVAALVYANIDYEAYHHLVDMPLGFSILGHGVTPHFLINDIFMVFFFGVATKEITESILPGGALNPPSKALNPLLGTLGGVLGPIATFFLLTWVFYSSDPTTYAAVKNGWGIPTATDIALAWLTARIVFGATHPAVGFLLLLAIADDAIGLVIIAIFYPDPQHPVNPAMLGITLLGMAIAWGLRRKGVKSWIPYIALGGTVSWLGLLSASLHPALALVPIVPFLPGPKHDDGLFVEVQPGESPAAPAAAHAHNPLQDYEHATKVWVDMGMFFFGFANAGVQFAVVSEVTWIILGALLIGKTVGIGGFSWVANRIGFPYPTGMETRHVFTAGIVGAMGLTVALFVTQQAYPTALAMYEPFNGPAKMGALASAGAFLIAFVVGKALNVKKLAER